MEILPSFKGEELETEIRNHQLPSIGNPRNTAQCVAREMACAGRSARPWDTLKRFSSADGPRLGSSSWMAGPASLRGGKENCDHYFDPLCGLICCPVWAGPDGGGIEGKGHDPGEQHSEARSQILRLCALQRYLVEKFAGGMEASPLISPVAGPSLQPLGRLWPSLTDDYCNAIIDAEYDEIAGPGGDGLSGYCLGCGSARPTLAILTPDNGCRHLVYCDSCGDRYIGRHHNGGGTSVPTHLWTDSPGAVVSCPLCRKKGRLLRLWRPEEAGGWNGRCLRCNVREASVVVLSCRHLSCCQACKLELTVRSRESSQRVVRCPACSVEGPSCNVFLP